MPFVKRLEIKCKLREARKKCGNPATIYGDGKNGR